jgi:hypothetical protein
MVLYKSFERCCCKFQYVSSGITCMWLITTISLCLLTAHPALANRKPEIMAGTEKIDLLKLHKDEYSQPKNPTIVEVGKAQYLAVDGKGAPGGPVFVMSVGAIYGVAYGIKMKSKQGGRDYKVAPLEALWWGSGDDHNFIDEPRETWNWRVLIRTPDFITEEHLREAIAIAIKRGKGKAVNDVRLETITEGRCVQILHKGPYADEAATIAAMDSFAQENHLVSNGYHHEIYLSDPNKTAPEKMRTILRQPVKSE